MNCRKCAWVVATLLGALELQGTSVGVDASLPAGEALVLWREVAPQLPPQESSWLRVREIALAFQPANGGWTIAGAKLAELRAQLGELRAQKLQIAAMIELQHVSWSSGSRLPGRKSLPIDLREVRALASALRENFDDLVDVWEVGNEPDIFYRENAESYAAVLKAFYLGYREQRGDARVAMGALGRPSTRYMESLILNDTLSYTDAFSFHLYGFAEDARPLFDQMVRDAEAMAAGTDESSRRPVSQIPILITELGYGGMMSTRATLSEAREQQARWYRRVRNDFSSTAPEALVAFVLKPYVSPTGKEMGLVMHDHRASPALVEWWKSPDRSAREVKLTVPRAAMAPPVVVDVILPTANTVQRTAWQVQGDIQGKIALYNFSNQLRKVQLDLPGAINTWQGPATFELLPGARLELPMRVNLVRSAAELRVVARGEWGSSVWRTTLRRVGGFPETGVALDTNFAPVQNQTAQSKLARRPRAQEERPVQFSGRWLVTPGASVVETRDAWLVTISSIPSDATTQRIVAELALPEPCVPAMLGNVELEHRVVGSARCEIEVQWRTEAGELFGFPFFISEAQRRSFCAPWESFEQQFFARPARKWRLEQNRLASIVIALRPLSSLPLTVEIRKFAARVQGKSAK